MAEGPVRVEDQDRNGRGLHTAGCGTGGSADQHQRDAEKFPGICKFVVVRRVKTGSSGSHGLKQGSQDPLFEGIALVFNDEE